MNFLKIKEKLLNLLFPIECLGCGRENVWLCENCFLKLNLGQNYFINKNAFSFLDGVFAVFNYKNKLVKKLIKTYKYNFVRDIGPILAEAACLSLKKQKEIDLKNILLISVPLHKKRKNWRGFNQAEIIAWEIASRFNLPYEKKLLRIKNNRPQAKLDREKRKNNVKNSFFWDGKNLEGKKILLIDDVATSGATLDECARALKTAGGKKIYALVIAHG